MTLFGFGFEDALVEHVDTLTAYTTTGPRMAQAPGNMQVTLNTTVDGESVEEWGRTSAIMVAVATGLPTENEDALERIVAGTRAFAMTLGTTPIGVEGGAYRVERGVVDRDGVAGDAVYLDLSYDFELD